MRSLDRIRPAAFAAVVAMLVALPLSADALLAQEPPPTEQTITVTATGRVERAPDQAVLHLAIESFAATADEAAADNAERMERLLAALRRLGLDEDDIETASYHLNPEYDYSPGEPRRPGEQRLVGYRAVNMVRVTIDDIDRVGEIIDASIAAGADRVNGVAFQLSDPDAARHDALRDAVDRAREEAETLASALGRRLGPALAISSGGAPPRPMLMARAAAFDSRVESLPPTPIQPGDLEIEASVTVVYRLEPTR